MPNEPEIAILLVKRKGTPLPACIKQPPIVTTGVYLIFETTNAGPGAAIACLACGSVSFNINDVHNRYCGKCHKFLQPYVDKGVMITADTTCLTCDRNLTAAKEANGQKIHPKAGDFNICGYCGAVHVYADDAGENTPVNYRLAHDVEIAEAFKAMNSQAQDHIRRLQRQYRQSGSTDAGLWGGKHRGI